MPTWEDAGFDGEPEFELKLRRGGEWCGTVFLSALEPGALIESAKPADGAHWFDTLDFSFHPRGKPPTYGRVDATGRFEQRVLSSGE